MANANADADWQTVEDRSHRAQAPSTSSRRNNHQQYSRGNQNQGHHSYQNQNPNSNSYNQQNRRPRRDQPPSSSAPGRPRPSATVASSASPQKQGSDAGPVTSPAPIVPGAIKSVPAATTTPQPAATITTAAGTTTTTTASSTAPTTVDDTTNAENAGVSTPPPKPSPAPVKNPWGSLNIASGLGSASPTRSAPVAVPAPSASAVAPFSGGLAGPAVAAAAVNWLATEPDRHTAAFARLCEFPSSILPRGIVNVGNTCYLNSVVQAVFSAPPFQSFLLQMAAFPLPQFDNFPLIASTLNLFRDFSTRSDGSTRWWVDADAAAASSGPSSFASITAADPSSSSSPPLSSSSPKSSSENKGPINIRSPFPSIHSPNLMRPDSSIHPRAFDHVLRTSPRVPQSLRNYEQCDAEEFLMYWLDYLDEECRELMNSIRKTRSACARYEFPNLPPEGETTTSTTTSTTTNADVDTDPGTGTLDGESTSIASTEKETETDSTDSTDSIAAQSNVPDDTTSSAGAESQQCHSHPIPIPIPIANSSSSSSTISTISGSGEVQCSDLERALEGLSTNSDASGAPNAAADFEYEEDNSSDDAEFATDPGEGEGDHRSTADGDASNEGWMEVGRSNKASLMNSRSAAEIIQTEFSPISSCFKGFYRSTVKRRNSPPTSTVQPFYSLSLEIHHPETTSLDDALGQYTAPEVIQTDSGEVLTKRLSFEQFPPVLWISLKRFAFSPVTFNLEKITKPIAYGESLTFHTKSETVSPVELDRLRALELLSEPGDVLQYKLQAAIIHHGTSCTRGHYSCFVRCGRGDWWSVNETAVFRSSLGKVLNAQREVYLLMYSLCPPVQEAPEN